MTALRAPLRVLHLYNMTALRCGIQNFGYQLSTALRRAGCLVDDWDVTYDTIYAKVQRQEPAYIPDEWADYDVIHFNWHPATNNHYGSGHFPYRRGQVRSVYLHDIPPWSGCPCLDVMRVVVTSEPYPDRLQEWQRHLELPYPVPDWVDGLPPPDPDFSVGVTGVRLDGFEEVRDVCLAHGWRFNVKDAAAPWLPLEEEIRRLARSTVNVCWYREGRGLAGAPSMCLASGRPLIINDSPMLRHLSSRCRWSNLERALEAFAEGAKIGYPYRGSEWHLSWTTAAQRLIQTWEEAAR